MKKIVIILTACFTVFFACKREVNESGLTRTGGHPLVNMSVASSISATVATPSEDAYVRGGSYTNKNYGSEAELLVKNNESNKSLKRNTYLKFSFASASGAITAAKLRVYGANTQDATTVPVSVFSTTDGWNENTITYTNRPSHSAAALDIVNVSGVKQWYEFDVTNFVKSETDGVASFVLKDDNDRDKVLSFASSESASNKPELVITTGTQEVEEDTATTTPPPVVDKPAPNKPDHIIFVFFENKPYSSIIGSSQAPFINSLRARGTLFKNANAVANPSYRNYIAFFGGDQNGVSNNDCRDAKFTTPNMYTALKAVNKRIIWYSEDLPYEGYTGCSSGQYREKHNPVTAWANTPSSINKPFSAFNWQDTAQFKNLPEVVGITPNMLNDMHDAPIKTGDDWLKAKLSKLISWCEKNNSVFFVYWDEGVSGNNKIPVIAVGENVKANYSATGTYSHYSFTKFAVNAFGGNGSFTTNTKNANTITEIWK